MLLQNAISRFCFFFWGGGPFFDDKMRIFFGGGPFLDDKMRRAPRSGFGGGGKGLEEVRLLCPCLRHRKVWMVLQRGRSSRVEVPQRWVDVNSHLTSIPIQHHVQFKSGFPIVPRGSIITFGALPRVGRLL